ncbi:GNAT family N-acetyltransferase [Morganella psychrotolerans]|uniref:GNAT family N-acetyltransferase n=1 Tax=Morganella psychrotolerans TaxID=368603 RepID=A0A5M9R411_9GAMM|nr:GNAT family N-acetyltransferase [Morganella psychrotolerans]KAA8714912.1 GNAT family N-acetyltransferase [Morganella psychrotolerans]OBU04637.1 acetyltransferase [Morganella psychrotolerans]
MTIAAPVFLLAPPQRDEAEYLTTLCLRSKQYWGYDEEFMATCRDDLTITAADFDHSRLMTARINGKIAGIVQLTINRREKNGKLSKLFVHPDYLRLGIGSALYHWAVSAAQAQRVSALLIDADPNAEAFYIRQGAIRIGETPSESMPGRVLPLLLISLH